MKQSHPTAANHVAPAQHFSSENQKRLFPLQIPNDID
eukprot:gene15333-4593_t